MCGTQKLKQKLPDTPWLQALGDLSSPVPQAWCDGNLQQLLYSWPVQPADGCQELVFPPHLSPLWMSACIHPQFPRKQHPWRWRRGEEKKGDRRGDRRGEEIGEEPLPPPVRPEDGWQRWEGVGAWRKWGLEDNSCLVKSDEPRGCEQRPGLGPILHTTGQGWGAVAWSCFRQDDRHRMLHLGRRMPDVGCCI